MRIQSRSGAGAFAALSLITALALALRLYRLDFQSLWYDEGLTAYRLTLHGREFALNLFHSSQFPLYYLLMKFWYFVIEFWSSSAVGNDLWLRLPSALFGAASVPLVYSIAERLFANARIALLSALFLAINTYHIILSQEARNYTLTFFLMLSSALFIIRFLESERTSQLAVFSAATVALLYTHGISFLYLPAFNAFFFVLCRKYGRFPVRKWVLAQAVIILLSVPLLISVLLAMTDVSHAHFGAPMNPERVLNTPARLIGYIPSSGIAVLILYVLTFLVIHALSLAFAVKENNRSAWLAVFLLTLIPFLEIVLIDAVRYKVSLFSYRYFIHGLIGVSLFLSTGIYYAGTRFKSQISAFLLFCCLVLYSYSIYCYYYNDGNGKEQWRQASNFVRSDYKPGDFIVFSEETGRAIFAWYSGIGGTAFRGTSMPNLGVAENTDFVTALPERVWIVSHLWSDEIRKVEDFKNRALKGYEKCEESYYHRVTVELYCRGRQKSPDFLSGAPLR